MPNSEITAAHEPHLPGDELDDIREHANRLPDLAGSVPELRALLLQALDDLEGAYARIDVAYGRLLGELGSCAHGHAGGKGCGPCSFDRAIPDTRPSLSEVDRG